MAEQSTIPGLRVMTMNPSSLSLRANFVVAMRPAAFVMPYPTMFTMLRVRVRVGSDAPEPMTMIFFVFDARRRGRNAVMPWIGPRLLTLYCAMRR